MFRGMIKSREKKGSWWIGKCPGFGWDRVNSLSGSWCSAVFWVWDENSVDNILMFLAVARQSRTFQLLMLPGAREAGRGHSRDS